MIGSRSGFTWVELAAVGVAAVGLVSIALVSPSSPTERTNPDRGTGRVSGDGPRKGGQDSAVVLTVNGESFTRREVEKRFEELPDYVRARYRPTGTPASDGEDQSQMESYVAAVAQFEALADVAERRGLGEGPRVLERMEGALQERALREAIRERLQGEEISDQAVESYYDNHIDQYRRPERRSALVIVAASEERIRRIRRELPTEATEAQTRLKAFHELARKKSIDPVIRERRGGVGWVQAPDRENEHPEIARVVFGLDERGAFSDVFRVGDRWYIATWNRRQKRRTKPLESVASDIRTKLYERRREELRERLLGRWRSEVEVSFSESVRRDLSAPDPPRRTRPEEIPVHTRRGAPSSNAKRQGDANP